ncbi:MAG TPA: cytochrome c [Casimicrobiaceae bacterium]
MTPRIFAAIVALGAGALAAPAAAADPGRQHYVLNCAGCHQFDGSGSRAHEIPNMRGAVGNFLRLPEGRAFLVQVPGTSNSRLSDAEIATLLNWMVAEFSREQIPPDFTPYTPAEVTRLRHRPLDDVAATRAAIAARLAAMGYRID